jgi:hypothetical protein
MVTDLPNTDLNKINLVNTIQTRKEETRKINQSFTPERGRLRAT